MFLVITMLLSLYFRQTQGFRPMASLSNTRLFPVGRKLFSTVNERYLHVPFEEKDEVKQLGARYDSEVKKWYVPQDADPKKFQKWQKTYLNVPFGDKDKVKALGAAWDSNANKWFITGAQDAAKFRVWIPGVQVAEKQAPKTTEAKNTPKPKADANKFALIIDIDTNGLPTRRGSAYAPYTALSNYDTSRIVQMSYILCHKSNFSQVQSESFIIKSDGFPIDNTEFHGVSKEMSLAKGVPFQDVGMKLASRLLDADTIITHNIEFDLSILQSELFRYGLTDALHRLQEMKHVCSMETTTDLVGLTNKIGGKKLPSMKDLVSYSLQEDLPEQHNSQVCVQYLRRSLQELLKQKKWKL